jgi:B12-binding domain/radical SAM domain protein
VIVLLRETGSNRYTINALTAILDACGVDRVVAGGRRELVEGVSRGLRRGRRTLVCYSFTTPDLNWVKEEVQGLAKSYPAVVLVAGGPHATADPEGTVELGFHHAFVGDAETTLPGFLASGGDGPRIVRGANGGPASLDAFPPFGRGRFGPVEITRGCSRACGFCVVGSSRVRHRTRESILSAAERLRASGRRKIFFITPNALDYGKGLGELETLLADLHSMDLFPVLGTFPSEVRPEAITRDVLQVLARCCHNRTLVIGAQSGSDEVLLRLGRGHSVADVVRAARTAHEFGFLPHLDLIFGVPRETTEERRATVELARTLRREVGARVHAHYFHPLPGTRLWGEDPTPLDEDTRQSLLGLRRGGAEDGSWQEQERWAWQILDWSRRGWILTPRRPSIQCPTDYPI